MNKVIRTLILIPVALTFDAATLSGVSRTDQTGVRSGSGPGQVLQR